MKKTMKQREEAREELYTLIDSGEIDIATAIKLIRAIYSLGQEDYAKKVGVSKKTLSNIETNSGNPTLESINKLLAPMKLKLRVDRQ